MISRGIKRRLQILAGGAVCRNGHSREEHYSERAKECLACKRQRDVERKWSEYVVLSSRI